MSRFPPSGSTPEAGSALHLVKASVRALAPYTLAAPRARRKLNQNEAPGDLPPELKRRIADRLLAVPWHRYPEFSPGALLERIAARHRWVADGVLVGNGSNEVIQATLAVMVGEGDAVVAPTPTFSLYRLITGVMGGRYLPVPLDDGFAFDVDRLIAVARRERARVIVLNSPNNPTGSALPPDGVERVLQATDAFVVADEAYQEFGGPTAVDLLPVAPRLAVMRTFSKAMGMAGLRFGYGLMHPEVAREVAKAKLPYNVNLVTLAAAEAALDCLPLFEERVRAVVAERERTLARLAAIPGLVAYPSAANFFLVRCGTVPAREVFRRLLDEHGILVRDVSGAAGLEECLRISVGDADDMAAVAAALERIFRPPEP
ncbi:MAG TPA: histidinol-phosphate transaminase [Gemmatimonadales bacterium]|nr:histidinol-phosphate transaminase [Gemmatimonadales bacterium]